MSYVANHITEAFHYQYIDAVFFPDMGHSHFYIPQDIYDKKYKEYPIEKMSQMYTDFFNDDKIRILYHTAEQLNTRPNKALPTSRELQWRYHTRNLIGKNSPQPDIKIMQNKESEANTLGELAGFYYYGGVFNISANKKGCFEAVVKGKPMRFDLSLFDLESKNSSEDFIGR